MVVSRSAQDLLVAVYEICLVVVNQGTSRMTRETCITRTTLTTMWRAVNIISIYIFQFLFVQTLIFIILYMRLLEPSQPSQPLNLSHFSFYCLYRLYTWNSFDTILNQYDNHKR